MAEITVFSMEDCSSCVVVKGLFGAAGIEFREVDAFTEEGNEQRIRALPTTIIRYDDGEVVRVAGGSPHAINQIKQIIKGLK